MSHSKTTSSSASLQQPDFENKVNQQKILKEKCFTLCFPRGQHTDSQDKCSESHGVYNVTHEEVKTGKENY